MSTRLYSVIGLPKADKIKGLLNSITQFMQTKEYQAMVKDSVQKTEKESERKRECHQARFAFQRGKREYENKVESKLATKYASGDLGKELQKAEAAYTRNKHGGVARALPSPT